MKRSLYWVTKDLRINDNTALALASRSDQLICVYVVDKKWFEANNFQSKPLGNKRWQFLQDCLSDFNQRLLTLGQQLYIVYGDTLATLNKLCDIYQINHLVTTKLPGTFEQDLVKKFRVKHPDIHIDLIEQFTLYTENSLPFLLENLPISYSKFRKMLDEVKLPSLSPTVESLPDMFEATPLPTLFRPKWLPEHDNQETRQGYTFDGGEQQGLKHLSNYFSSDAPSSYKAVRNYLEGWNNSSKFSAWLAYGCISVRQIAHSLAFYEQQKGGNNSTQCLFLEILWREYFQWSHFQIGSKLYQFQGVSSVTPLTTFYPERFKKWCLGKTPYPLVNACMNELRLTGYLSNRGRQIVASCLVNELSIDWRYGAAWFEEQLVDYDAAVNWGNWQYIAGVGVDPRGGRHFNIEKQREIYDGSGSYQAKWNSKQDSSDAFLDSIDASDWPVEHIALDER